MPVTVGTTTQDDRRPALDVGKWYIGTARKVDFLRSKEGRAIGGRPDKPRRDGDQWSQRHPKGTMRAQIEVEFDAFPGKTDLIGVPYPWDADAAPPWSGGWVDKGGAEGWVLEGQYNTFDDSDIAAHSKPLVLRTGQFQAKMSAIAERFGWQPFLPDASGNPVPQPCPFTALIEGKRVMAGKFYKEGSSTVWDWDIRPLPPEQDTRKEKPLDVWAGEILSTLTAAGAKMRDGGDFTEANVIKAAIASGKVEGLKEDDTFASIAKDRAAALGVLIHRLVLSCQERKLPVPPRVEMVIQVAQEGL